MRKHVVLSQFRVHVKEEGKDYVRKDFFDETNAYVSHISYSRRTGQIGIIQVDPERERETIGTQMILHACHEIHADEVWAFAYQKHPFWNRFAAFQYQVPAHPSITGGGFIGKKEDVIRACSDKLVREVWGSFFFHA